jgi:DNA-binding MarR family transcriptional regulator
VSREAHPTDRRAILVTLTERGAATTVEMRARQRQSAAWMFGELPRAELTGLVNLLDRVLARIRTASTT